MIVSLLDYGSELCAGRLPRGAFMEPLGQGTIRLMADPEPCRFDHGNLGATVRAFIDHIAERLAADQAAADIPSATAAERGLVATPR